MTQEPKLEQYDDLIKSVDWLASSDLPLAITLTEFLEPSEGKEAVIFPPTYAKSEKGERPNAFSPYQVDVLDEKLTPQEAARSGQEANNCLLDSVGSQANRMEAKFKDRLFSKLVPQIEIVLNTKVDGEERKVRKSLLEIGHRIADGAIDCTDLRSTEVEQAIKNLRDEASAYRLAKLAPTSLVFGFWDSRQTQYKFGRILSSTIRATNVARVNRSAQFTAAFDKKDLPELPKSKVELSEIGLDSVPSPNQHGGVRVFGQITRRTQINLVRLRALAVTKRVDQDRLDIDDEETLALRRYVLGLALVAARIQREEYDLRVGCLLRTVRSEASLVRNGSNPEEDFNWDRGFVLKYAEKAAEAFVVGENRESTFDKALASKALARAEKSKAKN